MKTWHWVIILLVVAIVLFIWGSFFHPFFSGKRYIIMKQYEVFRDLLAVILTLAGLGIALLGVAMYAWVSRALDDRVEKKVNEQTNSAAAALYLNLAYISWEVYENEEGQVIEGKEDQLKMAIKQSENALGRVKFLDERKFGRVICLTKNALAYHLCMRGYCDDAERAIRLGKYVYDKRWDYDYINLSHKFIETYAFVLIKMGDNEQKKKGVGIIRAALEREEFPADFREYIEKKYKQDLGTRKNRG